tara:strand:+ start:464 stop:574 length:111 start_codon:yes stop_codon:yes gene_type:complete
MTERAEEYAAWVIVVLAAFIAVFLLPYIVMEVHSWI